MIGEYINATLKSLNELIDKIPPMPKWYERKEILNYMRRMG